MKFFKIILILAAVLLGGFKIIDWINKGRGIDIFTVLFISVSVLLFGSLMLYVAGEPENA